MSGERAADLRDALVSNRSVMYGVTVRVAIAGRRRRRVLHVARPGPPDPQRDRGAEQRLAVRPAGSPGIPVGEIDGARLLGGCGRRARERARDRVDGRRRTGSTRGASWTPASPTACSSSSRHARFWQRSPSSGRFRFSATRPAALARTPPGGRARTAVAVALLAGRILLRPRLPAGARDHAAAELAAARERSDGGGRARRRPRRSPPATGRVRTTRTSTSRGRPRRRSSRSSRARGSSRGSLPTSRPRGRRCTSSCSAGARARSGREMADLLERKLAEGVEVRVIVDAFGSRPNGEAREMFSGLAEAGRADRRQRRPPAGPRRPLPRRSPPRLAPGRGRAGRPPQALRRGRRGRVDRRRWDRGPLRERRVPRRDGSRHG